MKEDTKRALALILAFCIPLVFCTHLYAASSYTDLANEFAIVINPAQKLPPGISGDIVIWAENRTGNVDIYGKNLSTGQE